MSQNKPFVIGTRHSKLALWQAETIKGALEQLYPGLEVTLQFVTTTGDKIQDKPLSQIGGKGLFTKELEQAMEQGAVHAAIHSLKDLPYELPAGFVIGAIPPRGSVEDVLVSNHYPSLAELPEGAVVGTSSLRRSAQLLALRPDLQIVSLRGNVDTRLRKLDEGQYDAIILAAAGLTRLGRGDRITEILPADTFIPAAGQGALAVEVCENNSEALALVSRLNDPGARSEVTAERNFSAAIGGSCQIPAGCYASLDGETLHLTAVVASPDGKRLVRKSLTGAAKDAAELGQILARQVLTGGGNTILEALHGKKEDSL